MENQCNLFCFELPQSTIGTVWWTVHYASYWLSKLVFSSLRVLFSGFPAQPFEIRLVYILDIVYLWDATQKYFYQIKRATITRGVYLRCQGGIFHNDFPNQTIKWLIESCICHTISRGTYASESKTSGQRNTSIEPVYRYKKRGVVQSTSKTYRVRRTRLAMSSRMLFPYCTQTKCARVSKGTMHEYKLTRERWKPPWPPRHGYRGPLSNLQPSKLSSKPRDVCALQKKRTPKTRQH